MKSVKNSTGEMPGKTSSEMQKIDLSEHPEFFFGVDHWRQHTSGLSPMRLSEAAIDFCRKLDPVKALRAQGGAGVQLKIASDTRCVEFHVEIVSRNDESFRDCTFALTDDSGETTHRMIPASEASGVLSWQLPEGNRNISFFFPWQTEVALRDFQIDADAEIKAVPRRRQIQLIGDSITEGMFADKPEASYANRLGELLGLDVINSGVGGLKLEPDFIRLALSPSADVVLLAFGVNDASLQKTPEQFKHDAYAALKILTQYPRQKTFLLLPIIWPGENRLVRYPLRLYRNILRESAASFPSIRIIEGEELLDGAPENFADGVHPNAQGMRKLARALAQVVK